MTVVDRVGGRVLLINPEGRVLLIHERFGADLRHWLTPGGGVEVGELPVQAAVREAYEETGIEVAIADETEPLLITQRLWSWGELTFDQVDHFFAACVAAGVEVQPRGLTEVEQQTLLGHRWWSVEELRRTDEVILPAELADVVSRFLAHSE